MKIGTIITTLAALSMLAAAPARAQLHFAASAGNLQYTLTDLAPDDGIAPSVTFAAPAQAYLSGQLERNAPVALSGWADHRVTTNEAALVQDWDASGAHAGVGYDDRRVVAASALDPVASGLSSSLLAQSQQAFTLAPHTRITFTVDAFIDLTLDTDPAKVGYAQAFAGIAVDHSPVGTVFDVGTWGLLANGALVENRDDWSGNTYANLDGGTIPFTWDNDSASLQEATVTYVAGAWGDIVNTGAAPLPVPEPGAWAMLLAGLAALVVRMGRRRLRLLAGLAAASLALPAFAQVEVTSQASNLRYTLTDLAPDDGTAASLVLPQDPRVALGNNVLIRKPGTPDVVDDVETFVTTPSSSARDLASSAHSFAQYDGTTGSAKSAADPIQDAEIHLLSYATTDREPLDFQLSPHTRVTFSMDMSVAMWLDPSAVATESAFADTLLSLNYRDQNGVWSSPIAEGVRGGIGWGWNSSWDNLVSFEDAHTVSITWENTADTWGTGMLLWEAGAVATVYWGAPPVPEPGEWAMLGVGVGLLGMCARRTKAAR